MHFEIPVKPGAFGISHVRAQLDVLSVACIDYDISSGEIRANGDSIVTKFHRFNSVDLVLPFSNGRTVQMKLRFVAVGLVYE